MSYDPRPFDFSPIYNALGGYAEGMEKLDKKRSDEAIGGYIAQNKPQEAFNEAARRGELGTMLTLKKADREERQYNQEERARIAQHFGGLAQAQLKLIEADPNNPEIMKNWTMLMNTPDFQRHFAKSPYGYSLSDPERGARLLNMEAQGWQDPTKQGLLLSETAKNQAQAYAARQAADNAKVQVNQVTGEYFNQKGPIPNQQTGNPYQAIANKAFFQHEAPKLITQHMTEADKAQEQIQTYNLLQQILPGAKTGWGEQWMLPLRKALSSIPGIDKIIDVNSIKDTELLNIMTQKGIFELVKQLRPATDLDMKMSQRAGLSLETDPTTWPIAIPILAKLAERSREGAMIRAAMYRSGQYPDNDKIQAMLDAKFGPVDMTPILKGQTQQQGQQAPGAQAQPQQQQQGAQPQQSNGPPPGAIQLLQQNRSNPDIIRQFEQKYGPGSAQRYLGQQ